MAVHLLIALLGNFEIKKFYAMKSIECFHLNKINILRHCGSSEIILQRSRILINVYQFSVERLHENQRNHQKVEK